MATEDWFALVAVLVCLLLSFFFAGSETALIASSRAHMLRLEKHGSREAGLVNQLMAMRERLVGENMPILSAHEELRGAVDLLHHEDRVEKSDRDMFGGVLDLRELTVSDVMLHRTKMITLNAEDPPEEIVGAVLAAPVTRLPLWRGTPENTIAILHPKDLLRALQAAGGDLTKLDIQTIALPPWFVPDVRPLAEQLKAFRRRKTHFALVVDEYGEVMGRVTLEDILEE